MSDRKLKILCLHGYRQNADVFRAKTGSLRKMLKNFADFHYITAPHLIPQATNTNETPGEECSHDQHGWWFTSEEKKYNSKEFSKLCIGFDESVQCFENVLRQEGPFDGVLGFSQGASFLSILCSLQQQQGYSFKFAIFFAGFKSRCAPHEVYYGEKLALPSLHVFGETDGVIPKEMSEDLLQLFFSPSYVLHKGGHYVPASGPQKESYIQFLERFKEVR